MKLYKLHINLGIIFVAAIFLLTGCKDQDIVVSIEHPETDQKYQIVNAYKLYKDFIEEAGQEENKGEVEGLYQTAVIDPVYEACFKDGEYLHMVDFLLEEPPADLAALKEVREKIDSKVSNESIKEALIKSSDLLPAEEETNVCVFPTTEENMPPGINAGSGKIFLFYNENYNEDLIKATVAHEYHHSVWTENYFDPEDQVTVLDNMVFEGKAVMFEKLVYPDLSDIPIDPTYTLTFWEMIENDLDKVDLNRSSEVLYGNGNLPYLYGYSEGYKMVESYLDKNPDMTPEEWIGIDEQTIFEEGDYLSNYR
ncbi:hypothetical protein J2Z83_001997 [Virgibacillus natechei]|uniref:DUF2268 domain-containing protein n=1 Tax=Virgibacillus natechei TaxID=1216297 RepID=A0ABS4IG17_9BACI|nr:DUF2268 domain-containing putative Zn-dependent protease [Virgibacillus natechei]MBP1969889.1 hypothetical protein [Virgibacillus natechei]